MAKKLSDYIKELQAIESKEGGDLEVWSIDAEEGSGFSEVYSSPTMRFAQKDDQGETENLYCSEVEYTEVLKKDISTSKKVVVI